MSNLRVHTSMSGPSSFPASTGVRHRLHYPSPRPADRSDQRGRPKATKRVRERMWVVAAWIAVSLVAALILVAALVTPRAAPAGSLYEPWRSPAAGGLLPYAHSHISAPLPGPPASGSVLPYRQP